MKLIYSINRYLYAKLGIGLTIPIKNHFYKGVRFSIKKHWLCLSCLNTFDLPKIDNLPMDKISCTHCHSSNVYHSTNLSKAIIERKPARELEKMCLLEMQESDKIAKRIAERKNKSTS